ncbi:MAG TPA: IclR family transcriptional regulator [Jiangellaceae bacterium]|nr:IclR family transcriptional regulator [Jiangellaceae bacterium]
MNINGTGHTRGGIQSIDRAVTVLQYLAYNGSGSVTEVSHELDVHKSTAFRILNTLVGRGLVEQHGETGEYSLGFGLVHLAQAVSVGPNLTRQAHEACQWLAEQTAETVTLSVLDGLDTVTIDQILASSSVVSRSWLGRRTPLHCTSTGKVALAHLPEVVRRRVLAGPHEQYTERTITDPAVLSTEIDQVHAEGYAFAIEELEEGLSTAAAPVRAADGSVIAAMGVTGPAYRLDADELQRISKLVREAAAQASSRLGYLAAGNGGTTPPAEPS